MLLIVATQTLYCASCVDVGNLMIAMVSGVVAGEKSQRQAKSVFVCCFWIATNHVHEMKN